MDRKTGIIIVAGMATFLVITFSPPPDWSA
jgi:hypothetical protein